jgi:hypothetical protein
MPWTWRQALGCPRIHMMAGLCNDEALRACRLGRVMKPTWHGPQNKPDKLA